MQKSLIINSRFFNTCREHAFFYNLPTVIWDSFIFIILFMELRVQGISGLYLHAS